MKDKVKNKEFYILMKNPPQYDRSKPFYEQDEEVLSFYEEEFIKITEGFHIDGFFVHPFMYWHLNYFITPIPQPNGDEKLMHPPLDDHLMYFIENYMRCKEEKLGLVLFGSRGWSKSTILSSILCWLNTTRQNGTSEVIGGDDNDLNAISRLLDIGFNNVNPAFKLPRNVSNWKKHIEFGIKTKGNERINYSDIFIKNANKGQKGSSEKGAGGSPIGFIIDEIGKFNPVEIIQSALPAFRTQYGLKCYAIASGTGGSQVLSKGAKKILKNPSNYGFLNMKWSTLNDRVPKEYRTWDSSKKFGMFIPGQMSYRLPVPKLETNLSEYLDLNSKYLSKLTMKVTDWKGCKEYIETERKKLETDQDALNKFKMYHPISTNECFLESTKNPFPVRAANRKLEELEASGDIGQAVNLNRGGEWLTKSFSDKDRAEDPHPGGEADAPVIIYNNHEFPTKRPEDHTYVSGMDGYKTDVSDTDSVGALYVLKRRNLDLNSPCEVIVASYAARPPRMIDFHNQNEILAEGYNAPCCMESIDTGFIQHLDLKQKAFDLLTPAISFSEAAQKRPSRGNSRFGIYPTKQNQTYMFNLFLDYCKEPHVVDINEDGTEVVKLGVEFINDPDLLREIIRYKPGGNHDRIIAFMHALTWCRELDKKGYRPKAEGLSKKKKKRQVYGTYGRIRTNPY